MDVTAELPPVNTPRREKRHLRVGAQPGARRTGQRVGARLAARRIGAGGESNRAVGLNPLLPK
jgi:hypothetical protein